GRPGVRSPEPARAPARSSPEPRPTRPPGYEFSTGFGESVCRSSFEPIAWEDRQSGGVQGSARMRTSRAAEGDPNLQAFERPVRGGIVGSPSRRRGDVRARIGRVHAEGPDAEVLWDRLAVEDPLEIRLGLGPREAR